MGTRLLLGFLALLAQPIEGSELTQPQAGKARELVERRGSPANPPVRADQDVGGDWRQLTVWSDRDAPHDHC